MSQRSGIVLARDRARYRVATPAGPVTAVLRRKARRDSSDAVVVGDRVLLDPGETGRACQIVETEPRRTLLVRRTPDGRRPRIIAANIDRVLVLTATADPPPVPQLLDRLLVVAEANGIPAAVVINKIDLAPPDALLARFRRIGYSAWAGCVRSGEGLEPILEQIVGHVILLTGPSGVGKSSLLNRVQPGLALRTGEVSAKVRRGRHTTVTAVMVPLQAGGFVVDTPGFSDVGVWGIEPRDLARCFPEMRGPSEGCKFADCRHLTEPACAVRSAVERGEIAEDRYQSYRALLDEMVRAPKHWE